MDTYYYYILFGYAVLLIAGHFIYQYSLKK